VTYILQTRLDNLSDVREVSGQILLIGRGGGAGLRLDDDAVALEHARIDEEDGRYFLRDQNSITGTYVNGKRAQRTALADGDRITIGRYLLLARISPEGGPLCLEISPVAAEGRSGGRVEARKVDYAAVYALERKFLNRTLCALLLAFGGAAFLLGLVWYGRSDIFRPGFVSDAHALFANQCDRCHQPWQGASEDACQECHGGRPHHKEQPSTPSCLSCHSEHRGGEMLTAVANQRCVRCHADLKTRDGQTTRFERKVTDFAQDHPEFAISVRAGSEEKRVRLSDKGARQADSAKIKLNHELHLKPGLEGAKGAVRLFCKDCHAPARDGMRMAPVSYQSHCKECHELKFDPQLSGRVVPHASPEIVDAYLVRTYAEVQGQKGAAVSREVRQVEARLFESLCKECHEMNLESRPLAAVQQPDIPETWFQHARFPHQSHRILECVSCHARVSRSRRTRDVLLPGIEVCQNCHRKAEPGWFLQEAAAPTACVACHAYHDKTSDRNWDGPLSVKRFLEGEEEKARPVHRRASSFQRYLRALGNIFGQQSENQ